MAAHIGFIDQILADALDAPKKQRHTIQRIYDRLREERGFDGGYTTVWDYVHPHRLTMREAFVPLAHPAGHAEADFGEAWAVVGGTRRKVHFLVVPLSHSDAIFVKAYLTESPEAFYDDHLAAFAFFGGVARPILCNNTRLAVAKILGDGTRKRSTLFGTLQPHYWSSPLELVHRSYEKTEDQGWRTSDTNRKRLSRSCDRLRLLSVKKWRV